jgi:hypothetical protein
MVTFRKKDDQPSFYHSLEDSEDQVRVIDTKQDPDIAALKPRCLICDSNQMKQVDTFIQCQNCGNIVDLSKGDILQDTSDLDLSSGRDPYAEASKPYMKSFSSDAGYNDYENFRQESENKVYRGSAQSAMSEELQEFEEQQRQIASDLRRKRSKNDPFD